MGVLVISLELNRCRYQVRVSSNGSGLAISALTLERPAESLESLLESVGNNVKAVEALTLVACATMDCAVVLAVAQGRRVFGRWSKPS